MILSQFKKIVKYIMIHYVYIWQSRMGSIVLYDLLYDIFYDIIILYLYNTNIMTNSISYRMIYLVWIDRIHNKYAYCYLRLSSSAEIFINSGSIRMTNIGGPNPSLTLRNKCNQVFYKQLNQFTLLSHDRIIMK